MITLQEAKECSYHIYYRNVEYGTIATREEFERDTVSEELEYSGVSTAEELFDLQLELGEYELIK